MFYIPIINCDCYTFLSQLPKLMIKWQTSAFARTVGQNQEFTNTHLAL